MKATVAKPGSVSACRRKVAGWTFTVFGLAIMLAPQTLLACAACYGASDSPLAKGFNWGILSLLFVVVSVLGGIAAFFVFIVRRASALNATSPEAPQVPHGAPVNVSTL